MLTNFHGKTGAELRIPRRSGSMKPENMKDGDDNDLPVAGAKAEQENHHPDHEEPHDFELLHHDWQRQGLAHSGTLLIYQDNVRTKDMRPADIVRAIGKLLASGAPLANELHSLNHWR